MGLSEKANLLAAAAEAAKVATTKDLIEKCIANSSQSVRMMYGKKGKQDLGITRSKEQYWLDRDSNGRVSVDGSHPLYIQRARRWNGQEAGENFDFIDEPGDLYYAAVDFMTLQLHRI